MIVGYAKLYRHREKADTSFEITNETFRLLGVISFQTVKCTGRHPLSFPRYFVQTMSDSMPLDSFERILRNLNHCDNKQLGKQEKFWKLLLVINEVNKRLLKLFFNEENKTIDESMIPYYGTHSSWQQINKKWDIAFGSLQRYITM